MSIQHYREMLADRCTDAENLHALLRAAKVSDDLCYDGAFTVTVAGIRCHVAEGAVAIQFPDPYGAADTDSFVTVRVSPSHLYTAVATIVEGVLKVVTPATRAPSTVDSLYHCGELMSESDPDVQRFPGTDQVQVTQRYVCMVCDFSTRVEVDDPAKASYIASNWWR